ncbi:MAG: protoglobin domain-containing protein [Verrucomicrobiae bacterium]|nr:protoglobin domain-containing protein [Verrucomicrobiae bacterium]
MTSSDRAHRLQFLNLSANDAEALRALRPLFEQRLDEVVDAFYAHLLAFPETAQLLADRTTVERLKRLQREYLLRITDGCFDEHYFEERLRIGRTHERVGLSPKWYLLAYHQFFQLLCPLIEKFYERNAAQGRRAMLALHKVFMLDASLAMEAYIASDRYRHLQQLESIVNDSADAIFSLDADHRVRTWNRAAERLFGWTAMEILGQHVSVLIPPELLHTGELMRIDEALRRHNHYQAQTVRLTKDGRRIPVELTVSLMRDPQGQIIGRSVILRDIGERQRLEEARLQAERLATIGAMSAKLAHEIRNPLSSVLLNLELVRDELNTLARQPGAEVAECHALLKSIDAEVRRIQRVTEDYLQFARLPKARRERIHLNELLAQGLSFLQSLFDATGVELQTDLDPRLPPIHADENQLWQAILNLIRNAIEAMPSGGTLTITTQFAPPDTVRLTIRDTGKGMTEAEQRKIFRPFYSTKAGGTGLGLPLTQQIISEHEGRIRCESTPGVGTTFFIELKPAAETNYG